MNTGPTEGIQVEQQLNQVVVDRYRTGLDQEDILIADNFLDHDMDFAVGQAPGNRLAHCGSQNISDFLG